MGEVAQQFEPWEIPPDESYWRALLQEDEYVQVFVPFSQGEILDKGDDLRFVERLTEERSVLPDLASAWALAQDYMRSGERVELTVTGYNRGGLLVEWNGLSGFVPASQVAIDLPHGDDAGRMKAFASRVGETLSLQVIECEPERNRLILSEQNAFTSPTAIDHEMLAGIHPGNVCRGKVTNVCPFGAFVDLGGVEGLIHISELAWDRIAHPEDVLQEGQEVDVYVLSVNPQQGRVALSLKRLQADPWQGVEQRYSVGQWVDGTVTGVVSFGAFVRLEEGLEGLLHVSKLRGNHAQLFSKLTVNQPLRVRILNIDSVQHRIGLGLE